MSKFIEIDSIDSRDKTALFKTLVRVDSICCISELEGDELDEYDSYFVIYLDNGREIEITTETYQGLVECLRKYNEQ